MVRFLAGLVLIAFAIPSYADTIRIRWVTLQDVHGLWGGVNVYVDGEGNVFAQVVERGGNEKRYAGQMKPANIPEFEKLLAATDFLHLKFPDRPGVPDEGRPLIRILLESGNQVVVEKWDNDKHEGFDRVYSWFLQRVETLKRGEPIYEGSFEPKWRPEGYR